MQPGRKMLFVDLDDTLLNRKKEITRGNHDAIRRTVEAGNLVVLCSGRPLCGYVKYIEELQLDREGCYVVSANGAQIYDPYNRRNLYYQPVTMTETAKLFEEAARWGLHCQTYDDTHLLVREMNRETEYYIARTPLPVRVMPDLPKGLEQEPIKVLILDLDDHAKLEAFREAQKPWTEGQVEIFFSNPYYLECVHTGNSKGSAVRYLRDLLQIPEENTLAAGDSENDLSMITACGIGCAVANATDAVKAQSSFITQADCDHDAIAEIIDRFMS